MSAALLLVLSLPVVVTMAIAIHEAAHHDGGFSGEHLAAFVHGHSHGQEIEDHDHEAVTMNPRLGTVGKGSSALRPDGGIRVASAQGRVYPEGSGPPLATPRSADLCIWQL